MNVTNLKPTKKQHESFSDFEVNLIKQFSAVDVIYAIKKTFESPKDYNKPFVNSEDTKTKWFIKEVLENIGFYR